MSILVTGASGFIGSSVTGALVSSGAEVVVLTRHTLPELEHVVQVTCDLGGHIDMTTLETIKEQPITAVVHCVAVTPWAKNADYSQDIQMAQNVIELARQLGAKRVVHLSGWNVYDMPQSPAPYDEATTLKPDTDYGKSKLAVEALLREELGDTVVSLRLASIYGPGQVSPGLITSLVSRATNEVEEYGTKRGGLF
jgi:UDP-glucose 4-epimerase